MKYAISHTTTYRYSSPVHQSYHLLHLSPAVVGHQRIQRNRLTISPQPSMRRDWTDYFGNPTTVLAVEKEHSQLVVNSESVISIEGKYEGLLHHSVPWQLLANSQDQVAIGAEKDVWQFAASSRHGKYLRALGVYAKASFLPDTPVLVGVNDLMRRIHEDFVFDPSATDVSTPVEQVFEARRGVCQDFAHLMISALRSLGLPARYVSGYILTRPPEGETKLQGADASHAWVSAWSPGIGWVDFDPTNNVIPNGEHITFAYGRDYDDISPISGVLLGGGAHSVKVEVDVVLMDDATV